VPTWMVVLYTITVTQRSGSTEGYCQFPCHGERATDPVAAGFVASLARAPRFGRVRLLKSPSIARSSGRNAAMERLRDVCGGLRRAGAPCARRRLTSPYAAYAALHARRWALTSRLAARLPEPTRLGWRLR